MAGPVQDKEFLLARTILLCGTGGDWASPNSSRLGWFSFQPKLECESEMLLVPVEFVDARLIRLGRGMSGGHIESDRLC